jgi:hypothetical protein
VNSVRTSVTGAGTATIGLLVPLAVLDRRMVRSGGPGIIPFELAGARRSTEIIRAWGPEGTRAARASLLLDFPFLVAYTMLNVALTRRAGHVFAAQRQQRLARAARFVTGLQIVAGGCDAVENSALIGVLARGGDERLASVARAAASAKFAALIIGGIYGVAARVARHAELEGLEF